MIRHVIRTMRKYVVFSIVGILVFVGAGHAQNPDELNARLDAQDREIQELKKVIHGGVQPAAVVPKPDAPASGIAAAPSPVNAPNPGTVQTGSPNVVIFYGDDKKRR